jgi:cytochrome c-type biogenesis protein CcmH
VTVFVILCVLLAAAALALLLPPLLGRPWARAKGAIASNKAVYFDQLAELDAELEAGKIDRGQWETARGEIERRALDEAPAGVAAAPPSRSRAAAVALGLALPAAAAALYVLLGNPQALRPAAAPVAQQESVTPQQFEAMVEKLALRLKNRPDDVEGWTMLGRSYSVLGRYPDSVSAYARAVKLRPGDSALLADYADALAMSRGRDLTGIPEKLLARALELDPSNVKALALAGTAAFQRRDYKAAVGYWQQALPFVPDGTEVADSMRGGIAQAEARMRAGGGAPAPVARGAEQLKGQVSLAPAAAGKVGPEDAVFVYARAAEGPRMPLAVLRRQVKDLPFEFSLDDSMAMNPALRLSGFSKVVVVARVSKSGSAAPAKGDLEASSAPLAPGTKGIRLEIAKAIE